MKLVILILWQPDAGGMPAVPANHLTVAVVYALTAAPPVNILNVGPNDRRLKCFNKSDVSGVELNELSVPNKSKVPGDTVALAEGPEPA